MIWAFHTIMIGTTANLDKKINNYVMQFDQITWPLLIS